MDAQNLAPTLVGLTEAEAKRTILSHGLSLRVTRHDDRRYTVTMDYHTNRVNLQIDNGRVTKASVG